MSPPLNRRQAILTTLGAIVGSQLPGVASAETLWFDSDADQITVQRQVIALYRQYGWPSVAELKARLKEAFSTWKEDNFAAWNAAWVSDPRFICACLGGWFPCVEMELSKLKSTEGGIRLDAKSAKFYETLGHSPAITAEATILFDEWVATRDEKRRAAEKRLRELSCKRPAATSS